MITDNDSLITQYISIPREMSQLNCGAFMAGITRACLDGAGFNVASVTAHSTGTEALPYRTTILITMEDDKEE